MRHTNICKRRSPHLDDRISTLASTVARDRDTTEVGRPDVDSILAEGRRVEVIAQSSIVASSEVTGGQTLYLLFDAVNVVAYQ